MINLLAFVSSYYLSRTLYTITAMDSTKYIVFRFAFDIKTGVRMHGGLA